MNVLTVVVYAAMVIGAAAVIAGVAVPRLRRPMFWLAAGMFTVVGVLGILSIGILFLAAAVVCVWVAARTGHAPRPSGTA
jgi:hypothetical protein